MALNNSNNKVKTNPSVYFVVGLVQFFASSRHVWIRFAERILPFVILITKHVRSINVFARRSFLSVCVFLCCLPCFTMLLDHVKKIEIDTNVVFNFFVENLRCF